METTYKAVPDVEALRYKGTPEKPDIKIFVSHRIDLDSETIDNPLYIPVRCGAVYDKREGVTMLGDDTGDNISEKRETFNEFTVMYWVWKNVDADYYGLCHYRRYLSFSSEVFPTGINPCQHVECEWLDGDSEKKYGLDSAERITSIVKKTDGCIIDPIRIDAVPTPKGLKKNVKAHWSGWEDALIKQGTLDKVRKIINDRHPTYKEIYDRYLNSKEYYGFNCFILRKELFQQMCEFVFDVVFELEKQLDVSYYSETMLRTCGYMGELLTGMFLYKIAHDKQYSIAHRQLVYFKNTEICPKAIKPVRDGAIPIVLMASDFYFPYVGVFIKSLMDSSGENNYYDIIVLHKSITLEHQKQLEKLCRDEKENFSIRFYNPTSRLRNVSLYIASATYSEEAYYRILVPWILRDYDKAICMDADIIALKDIAELYAYDVDNVLAAGVKDVVYQGMLNLNRNDDYNYSVKEMKMKNPYNYINTGVLLMNLKAMREKWSEEEIVKFAGAHKFRIQEQDILNVLLEGNVLFLPIRWNCYVEGNSWVSEQLSNAPVNSLKEYRKEEKEVILLHYASQPKPWDEPSLKYAEIFWNVARATPFYEELIGRIVKAAVAPLSNRVPLDMRTGVRKFADKLLPLGTGRRKFAKMILPKGSLRWCFCKQIYYIFKPQYRPVKQQNTND
jgi:lipopolysaccharide biosynthesis glycosyltransferase